MCSSILNKKSEMWEHFSVGKEVRPDFLSPHKGTTSGIGMGQLSEDKYLQRFKDWVERYQESVTKEDLEKYPESKIGEPKIVEYMGYKASVPYIKNFALAKRIAKIIDIPNPRIVEIGAGYGGMAEILLRLIPIESYTVVDLEEVLPLSKFYLTSTHQDRALDFRTPDKIGDGQYDIVVNVSSFGEMPKEVAQAYVSWSMDHAKILISQNSVKRTASGVRKQSEYGFHKYRIADVSAPLDIAGAFHDQHLLIVVENGQPNFAAEELDKLQTCVSLGLHEDINSGNQTAMKFMVGAAKRKLFRKGNLRSFTKSGKSLLAGAYASKLLDRPIEAPGYIEREVSKRSKKRVLEVFKNAFAP